MTYNPPNMVKYRDTGLGLRSYNTETRLRKLLDQVNFSARGGRVASYIPELVEVDAMASAISICASSGDCISAGDHETAFTMQGISKIVGLLYALEGLGQGRVFRWVGMQPTRDSFAEVPSFYDSRASRRMPANPFTNAGAMVLAALYPGRGPSNSFAGYLGFLRRICGNELLDINEDVLASEKATSHINRSIAWTLASEGGFPNDPPNTVDYVEGIVGLYLRQCSVDISTGDLARLAAVLANGGRALGSNIRLAEEVNVQTALSIAQLCGLHADSGRFMTQAGVPAVCGVSGGVMGVVPGRLGIATYNPRVDEHGISVVGRELLRIISSEEGLRVLGSQHGDAETPSSRYSCFISYSHLDEGFASYLRKRLQAEGIRVWFAPEDMRAGRKSKQQIHSAIIAYDKLLVVLSDASLRSPWVIAEILEARKKERDTGKQVLFPISLVSFQRIRDWECFDSDTGDDVARSVREYHIPDFQEWKDRKEFNREFSRLVSALEDSV